jgi:inorganic pyrophosphatase
MLFWNDYMDISKIEPGNEDNVNVFVESVKGSKSFYEYDNKSGLFTLKKNLKIPFPGLYGFIPKTHHIDAEPLDVLILTSESLQQGIIVQSKPIGLIRLRAEIPDDVLIAISTADKEFENTVDISNISKETLDNLKEFLEQFKELEIENVFNAEHAKKSIRHAIDLYKREFG